VHDELAGGRKVEKPVQENGGGLQAQAELADLIKAKAAFAAMLTDDVADREQYEKLRDEALQLLLGITDGFYAAFARHHIIRCCIAAGETEHAVALLSEVEDEFVLDDIREEFPYLRTEPQRSTPLPDTASS
jgi:hypothetical protein